jgi:endoglucanase
VLCGEGGAHNRTSHPVVLAWLWDAREVPKGLNAGHAVWRFHRSFGILDSGCADVEHQGGRGHKLDRKLHSLLQHP